MRILLTAASKFHAFHLASQLDRMGHLGLFLTTYYSGRKTFISRLIRRKDAEVISPDRVRIFPWVEGARALDRIPTALKKPLGIHYTNYWYHPRHVLFDLWASRFVDSRWDLVVGWAEHSLFTLRRARRLGLPTVLYTGTAHNRHRWNLLQDEYERWGLSYRLPPQILRRSLKEYEEAPQISVVSGYAGRTFVDQGIPADRIIRITPGVDHAVFSSRSRRGGRFRVIYAGLLDARKGIVYLLEAWKRLAPKDSELRLVGTVYDEIRPLLRKYEGLFVHTPAVPQSRLADLFGEADLFVLPSLDEGFAAVLLQAMACGLPVVTTTNSGGEDVIQDGLEGFIVPIRSPEALREKIEWLHRHKAERERMGRAAAERARRFTWDRYGRDIVAHYSALTKYTNRGHI